MYKELMGFTEEHSDMNEMVSLAAHGQAMVAMYATYSLPAPERLKENLELIDKTIRENRKNELKRALRLALTKKEALKSESDKRKDLDEEIAKLQAALNG